jgi:hypothetical protein
MFLGDLRISDSNSNSSSKAGSAIQNGAYRLWHRDRIRNTAPPEKGYQLSIFLAPVALLLDGREMGQCQISVAIFRILEQNKFESCDDYPWQLSF